MFTEILGIVFLSLSILQLYWSYLRRTGNAPSFHSFPIFGHLPYLVKYNGKGFHVACTKWAEIYGPIFRVDLGSHVNIIINDYKLIREAWNIPELCGRVLVPASSIRMGDDGRRRGIASNSGIGWLEQRRFTIKQLKDFGLRGNSSSMESIILDECMELIRNFKKEIGKPISTEGRFNGAVINVLWTIVAGKKFNHDDPKLAFLVECITKNLTASGSNHLMIFMPTLAKLFPKLSGWKTYVESLKCTHEFIQDLVHGRIESHREGVINDFTDAYITEIKKTMDPDSSFYKEEGIKSFISTLDDLFLAGGETTSTALAWTLLYLSIHPEIQEKLYSEIEAVVGHERLPSLSDTPNMPYCEAVILEVLRKSSFVPMSVPHAAMEDVIFHGIEIPKDSCVMSNLYFCHHDPKFWDDPEEFRPERFLSPNGKTLFKHEAFLPFSSGKRICPGESLARSELFLLTTSLYQVFKISLDLNSPKPTMEGQCDGLAMFPKHHKLVFLERN